MPTMEDIKVKLAALAGSTLLRTLSTTLDIRVAWPNPGAIPPGIIVFWHGDQLMLYAGIKSWLPHLQRNFSVLMSAHRDGRYIAEASKYINIRNVEGSSSRGGVNGMRGLLRLLTCEEFVGITPDGPRGPCYQPKDGVIQLAAISQRPLYPLGMAASNCWTFKSWDALRIPKPFARLAIVHGSPIMVEKSLPRERYPEKLIELAAAMKTVRDEAEGLIAAPHKASPAERPSGQPG